MIINNELNKKLNLIKSIKPVILCLTNKVTMDFMANVLLAIGAAPIMSCDYREINDLIKISKAININIGTLDSCFIQQVDTLMEYINKNSVIQSSKDIPIILDPVGCGASTLRDQLSHKLAKYAHIIKGNASEIIALDNLSNNLSNTYNKSLGVEANTSVSSAVNSADNLSKYYQSTIVISGKEDYITNGVKNTTLHHGAKLMTLVSGMGCCLSAVIAAFRSVISDNFLAAYFAVEYFTLCGQETLRANQNLGPAMFKQKFIDTLYFYSK